MLQNYSYDLVKNLFRLIKPKVWFLMGPTKMYIVLPNRRRTHKDAPKDAPKGNKLVDAETFQS